MSKRKLNFRASDIKRMHSKLKKMEKKDPSFKINGLPVSSFLIANLRADDAVDTPEIRTKRIILQIAGDFSTKPIDLKDNVKLKINLLYGDDEYSLLQMRLNSLVKEYKAGASVSDDEAGDCVTVGDCTELVDSKIK